MCAQLLQLSVTLCEPMDCSPSGSSVHGICQARIVEWVAMLSCRGPSRPRDQTHPALQADSLPTEPPGKPVFKIAVLNQMFIFQIFSPTP